MGSVIDYNDCPRCGEPNCVYEFYYKTGEEFIFCPDCGYEKIIQIINRDLPLSELKDDDIKITELKSYCAYSLSLNNNGLSGFGSLKTFDDYLNFVNEKLNDNNVKKLIFSRYNGYKIIKIDFKDILRKNKIKKLIYG